MYSGASTWAGARAACGEGGTGLCTRAGRTQGSGASRVLQTAHVSWSNLAKTVSPVRAVAARAAACVGCDRKIHVGWVKRTRSRSPGPAKVICPPAATVHNNASPGKRVHPAFWAPVRVAASCSGPLRGARCWCHSEQAARRGGATTGQSPLVWLGHEQKGATVPRKRCCVSLVEASAWSGQKPSDRARVWTVAFPLWSPAWLVGVLSTTSAKAAVRGWPARPMCPLASHWARA